MCLVWEILASSAELGTADVHMHAGRPNFLQPNATIRDESVGNDCVLERRRDPSLGVQTVDFGDLATLET